jgi:choline dehydrogenase-like flavoprotein
MKPIVVVGSGPSGVHYARTLLDLGHRVRLIDVGYRRPQPVLPGRRLDQLKEELPDPISYFLGSDFNGVTFPGNEGEYYGVPPGKSFVFDEPPGFAFEERGFAPLFSFAQGGLAEAWTGGVYPFNEAELADFPFSFADLAPAYAEVARRIGVSGEIDDLSRFMPPHEHIMEPLELDRHSRLLLDRYDRVRRRLNDGLGCWIGRSRLATLSRPRTGRSACTYLGRCLWGCPTDALYTPSVTLRECLGNPDFEYVPDMYVTHFDHDDRRRVTAIHGRTGGGEPVRIETDMLALAAGALNTARIFLESVYLATGEILRLPGLMDNQQILVPFVNLDMIGIPFDPSSYQYHQLGLGLSGNDPRHYVHGQITTLKTTMAHPILQNLPLDLRASRAVFRRLRSALGLVNVNFHDSRRPTNVVTLAARTGRESTLVVEYEPATDEQRHIDDAIQRVRAALLRLHCIAPRSMIHVRPKGASVHYAGMLPMTETDGGTCTAGADGRSRDFDNLFLVDGSTFPFLPAKNITFTLMANAVRMAKLAFS